MIRGILIPCASSKPLRMIQISEDILALEHLVGDCVEGLPGSHQGASFVVYVAETHEVMELPLNHRAREFLKPAGVDHIGGDAVVLGTDGLGADRDLPAQVMQHLHAVSETMTDSTVIRSRIAPLLLWPR
ncbi:DUF3846 domain-containing protein [Arthrobacter woluwensis]|uniref:DUF3846 domain-containing protein n=1 Tax=Arthrobacter woluwensis TaxID=156980 RepID=UPI003830F211